MKGHRMTTSSRYSIPVHYARPPAGGYPANFQLENDSEYIKFGHQVFPGSSQRGDDYWSAEIITQTWYQAETGKIPISGAGYGGKFSGDGFDGIWLDMSEIVRPTRDGIHGRELISTNVDLGGRLMQLEFDDAHKLVSEIPPLIELPLPIILGPIPMPLPGRGAIQAMVKAAAGMKTICLIDTQDYQEDLTDWQDYISLRTDNDIQDVLSSGWIPRYLEVEVDAYQDVMRMLSDHGGGHPESLIGIRLPLGETAAEKTAELVEAGVRVVHLSADEIGMDESGTAIPESLHAVHLELVNIGLRDKVTLIVSGGIAAAEHVAKVVACGADLVAIDFIMLAAWGCSLWADKQICHVETESIDPDWGAQRIMNLINAWRDQLLEALGAMGLREVRRLRGEMGRTIWNIDELREFRSRLGGETSRESFRLLPQPSGGEGDYRWPTALLLSTQQQARTGGLPDGELEFRVGASDGGFDRLIFRFELESGFKPFLQADPGQYRMGMNLNKRQPGMPDLEISVPWYSAGMSLGSISLPVMLSRVLAARELGTLCSTGEGGYPGELGEYADHVITQVATGLFGVNEITLQHSPMIEIKYAQGAKPGLGGHLLGNKNTRTVADIREAVEGISLFSPFPFHSVYSVEDHKKHIDWLKQVNPDALISVKVSTPTDVDMVAVGSYYAGAHVIHLDGAYGGTGAAPEIAKKNIAMPIEYAIPKVHNFLISEGIRDEVTLMASGGLRSAWDAAKAIALGADGVILGTAELVALGCIRIAQCEKGHGCPFGITTTDPDHARKISPETGSRQIVNMYRSWLQQLAGILELLGMQDISQLRGRSDLLLYLED